MITAVIIKLILAIGLLIILYQDVKERAVWWFLFPLILLSAAWLHFQESIHEIFWQQILINLMAFLIVFGFAFLYAVLKMKADFLKEVIGLGDLLFFLALSFAFPTSTFVVVLVFSMIFSLALHLVLNRKSKNASVPLAGYASLFQIFIYLSNWTGIYNNLYQIG